MLQEKKEHTNFKQLFSENAFKKSMLLEKKSIFQIGTYLKEN